MTPVRVKTWRGLAATALALLLSGQALGALAFEIAAATVGELQAQDTAGTLAGGQQLPFDSDPAIYVAHAGRWACYSTGLYEEAEIEDHVAVFGPGEKMSDDPEIWAAHQINSPTRPPGWVFYAPDASEPMGLHIIISDAQSRLGAAEVRDYDTGSLIETLSANDEGSEIEGSVLVSPGTELFRINLTEKAGGAVLAQVGALTARVDKVAVFSHMYSWEPNRGVDHQGQPCVTDIGEPCGDPADATGKKTSGFGGGKRRGCVGNIDVDNDTGSASYAYPRYGLDDKEVVREESTAPTGAPPEAFAAIDAALKAARAPYQGGQSITQAVAVPPFSRGKVHWPVELKGECTAIIGFPYEGRQKESWDWKLKVEARIRDAWGLGIDKDQPSNEVVAGVDVSWGPDDEKEYLCGAPFPVGDVWGLRASAMTPAAHLSGITEPVTFRLRGDITAPDGLPGPIGAGSGECERGEAWTTPAPPGAPDSKQELVFDGNGECTLELQKGYNWSATGNPQAAPWGNGSAGPFSVPGTTGVVKITCPLIALLCLEVQTSDGGGTPTPAEVELYKVTDQGDQPAGNGNSAIDPQTGKAIWAMNAVPPGNYKVKARVGGGDWSEVAFAVSIGVEFVVPVEV